MSRNMLFSIGLAFVAGLALFAGHQTSRADGGPFLGFDMRLYFEGPPLETAKSAQSIILIYLPGVRSGQRNYNPAHISIAEHASRLSSDVQVVPLKKIVPVPDEHTRNWLRVARCHNRPSILPSEDMPLIYFSFAGRSGRYCVGIASTGAQSAELIWTMRDLEETHCSYKDKFKHEILNWMSKKSDAQYDGARLEDFTKLQALLSRSSRKAC